MNHPQAVVQRLLASALAYLLILAFFGALRWGSGAMILFAGLWVMQALRELSRANRTAG